MPSACLYVCLFVCLSVRSHITTTNFTKLFVHVTYDRGSVLLWRQGDMLCTSGLVDDVTFSHNRRMDENQRRSVMLRRVRYGDGTGAKSAVCDRILFYFLAKMIQEQEKQAPTRGRTDHYHFSNIFLLWAWTLIYEIYNRDLRIWPR